MISGGLSTEKPPWELHLLSQNDELMLGKRDAVIVFLAHRCLADWISLAKLLCTCLSDTKTYYHVSEVKYSEHVINVIKVFLNNAQKPYMNVF